MQEHEYKARDKTVQKMSRDGLREENLRNKEEKRITGRDTDTEISRSEKKEELDFSKRRQERLKEEREMEQPEQSSRKPRYSREHADILDDEQDIATDVDVEEGLTDDSSENPKSAFRTESIRGQPRGERAYLETVADSRDLRKKKMVRDYAAKERRKEKETSREEKAAKRESARYRETSEVMEDSLDKFHEEIKGKSKRERVLKEQRKKVSRLSFGDEGDGMVHGAGIGIRNPASAVKDAAVTQTSVPGMGFNGIAAAFLGGLNPIGTIFSSYFIQHITSGGTYVDKTMYCTQISDLISAVIIYLCGFVFFFRLWFNRYLDKKEEKKAAKAGKGGTKE